LFKGSDRTARKRKIKFKEKGYNCQKKRMKPASASYFPLAACLILLHFSLVPLSQATVSECLTCVAMSTQNGAAADACRAGDAANIPKAACVTPSNHGCSVTVQKIGGITTWTRSCCPENTCQDDVHTNAVGQEFDADSCLTENCNTMDPTSASSSSNSGSTSTSVMIKMVPCTLLLVLLLCFFVA